MAFDADLARPLSGATPMGPALEDWEFAPLDAPPPGPDAPDDGGPRTWLERRDYVLERLERSRDIRLYARLAEAEAHLGGPTSFRDALALLDVVVREHWEELHPKPADDRRARNARRRAFPPVYAREVVGALERAVVFDAGGFDGPMSIRAFYLATEKHLATRKRPPREDEVVLSADRLRGLIAGADAGKKVSEAHAALVDISKSMRSLEKTLTAIPEYETLRFEPTAAEIMVFAAALEPFLPASAPPPAAAAETVEDPQVALKASQSGAQGSAAGSPRSRAEAMALVDAVLRYYAREAPSSPVPLVLLKLRQMGEASFTAWLAEAAPGGWEEAALPLASVDAEALTAYAEDAPAAADDPRVSLLEALDAVEAAAGELDISGPLAAARAAVERLTPQAAATPGIRDRAAVSDALRRLAAYFKSAEPSSPASLCIERAIDLVDRGFLDTVKALSPQGGGAAALRLGPGRREPADTGNGW